MPRNRTFVPAVDGLESRKLLSAVPVVGQAQVDPALDEGEWSGATGVTGDWGAQVDPALDEGEWSGGTGVTGNWGAQTLDQFFDDAANGDLDYGSGYYEWGAGTAVNGDWGDPAIGGPTPVSPADPYN